MADGPFGARVVNGRLAQKAEYCLRRVPLVRGGAVGAANWYLLAGRSLFVPALGGLCRWVFANSGEHMRVPHMAHSSARVASGRAAAASY